jgi:hypothetical protein
VLLLIFTILSRLVARWFDVDIAVTSIAFFLFPITAILALIIYYEYNITSLASRELIFLFLAYYVIDPLLWRGLTSRSERLREALPAIEQSRTVQVVVASMLFEILFGRGPASSSPGNPKLTMRLPLPALNKRQSYERSKRRAVHKKRRGHEL